MTSDRALRDPPGRGRRHVRRQAGLEEPILAELFSVERLEQHAQTLAAAQTVTDAPRRGHPVQPRIAENGRILLESYRMLARAIKDERVDHPGRRMARRQLPDRRRAAPRDPRRPARRLLPTSSRSSPRATSRATRGSSASPGRTSPTRTAGSTRRACGGWCVAYQEVEPLTIGELWAIAISLRILLVENLRRLARADRAQPGRPRNGGRARRRPARPRPREPGGRGGRPAPAVATRRCRPPARVQLFQRLRDQDPAVTPALGWLEERLAAQGTTAEETVRIEHQRQATMNVTVRNVITSMRLISWFDWAQFVESVSLVDEVLRDARARSRTMDFATRDRYRHAVEELARGLGAARGRGRPRAPWRWPTRGSPRDGHDVRRSEPDVGDPGYYLISDGRPTLERALERPCAAVRPAATGLCPERGVSATSGPSRLVTALVLAVPLLLCWDRTASAWAGDPRRDPRARPGVGPGDRPRQSRP